MSYIIVAGVDTTTELNCQGVVADVDARILSDSGDGFIKFDLRGDFDIHKELTMALCRSLIDAGFVEFTISHSY